MNKQNLIVGASAILVIIAFVLITDSSPAYSVDDFENERRVFYDPRLPREELDLRLAELKESEAPREEEDPAEAARDALNDYLNAGLYGEAWRMSQIIEGDHKGSVDADYFELKGDLLFAMDQYRDAVEAYDQSLKIDKNQAEVYGKLADIYLYWTDLTNKRERALALYEKSLSLDPSPNVHSKLQKIIEALKNSS